jgi:signal transduction histidine kinase
MTRHSLRLRLVLAQLASIAVALTIAGVGLVALFERHLERRVDEELMTFGRQLIGQLAFAAAGEPTLQGELADPRFRQPLSGLYWQIEIDPDGITLRSRSLWDQVLALAPDTLEPGADHRHTIAGPGGATLIAHERLVLVETAAGERRVRVATAIDSTTIETALSEYAGQLALALVGLALVLAAAAWAQIRFGLRPFEDVRRAVLAVRERRARRLARRFPDEIQPLADEVDALLDSEEALLDAARKRAADLAHGLKTPLTVLKAEAGRLAAAGDAATAAGLADLARDMQRHIDRELARSRLASPAGRAQATSVATVIKRLVATLMRTPTGERLDWQATVPADLVVAVDADNLAELLGNLLDNAAKWARETITITAVADAGCVTVTIADDGPGVAAIDLERLGTRGMRLDATTPGHGIGLAIARDIALAYAGKLAFAEAAIGGLAVRLELPAAQPAIGHASSR